MSSACPFSPFTTPHRAPPGVPTRPLDGPSSSLTDSARCSPSPPPRPARTPLRRSSTRSPRCVHFRRLSLSRARARPPARVRGEGNARGERAPPSPRPRTRAGGVSRRPRDATRDAIDAWTRRGRAMNIFFVASARFQRARARRWTTERRIDRETDRRRALANPLARRPPPRVRLPPRAAPSSSPRRRRTESSKR